MSSSDSTDLPSDNHQQPDHQQPDHRQPDHRQPDHQAALDPVIADAVDGVTNRFGAEGLEQMIAYAEASLTDARAALQELADSVDQSPA